MSRVRRFLLPAVVLTAIGVLDAQIPTTSGHGAGPSAPSGTTSSVGVLYSQYDNAGDTTNNVTSQDFETGFDNFDNQAADDFTVPAGEFWRVVGVDVDGFYGNGTGPAASVNVFFYSNGGGSLPGVLQCARTGQSFTGSGGDFSVTLSSPCVLGPGTHWLSVQAREDFAVGGQWFWTNRTAAAGTGAAWINPGNGFGSGCTSWGRKTTCLPTQANADEVFRLLGNVDPMVTGDFDGDGKTDYSVLRVQGGPIFWYSLGAAFNAVQWGNTGNTTWVFEGDYDGDNRADQASCSNASPRQCYVRRSLDGSLLALPWGTAGDNSLVPGDYDGDGRTDFAVFRPSNGVWYVNRSSDGSLLGAAFGLSTDQVAPGDYDADGRTDFAVFRASTGTFYMLQSTAGFGAVPWGTNGDVVVPGDYDGDGKADPAIARNTSGNYVFYVRQSSNGALLAAQWGLSGDMLAVGDYDGDKKTDFGVWRNGTFYVRKTSNGALIAQPWGQVGDYPLMNYNTH